MVMFEPEATSLSAERCTSRAHALSGLLVRSIRFELAFSPREDYGHHLDLMISRLLLQ